MASLPEVDSRRVACCGLSVGSYLSWSLTAMSDDIKFSPAPHGAGENFVSQWWDVPHCFNREMQRVAFRSSKETSYVLPAQFSTMSCWFIMRASAMRSCSASME